MSYVVLARKWRPMKFEDVVSQEHVTTTLKNAIEKDRLASAYLFSGPRGVGKTTTARIFAKAINCEKGPSPTPCNACSSCKEITESRSLDVFERDGASNRGIDEVRNLRENLRYAASKGKHKIYIIDEVHMLTTEAFNALLKTLEEPPPRVLFIFATTEFHKVPATILSRCQRYDFRRIPPNEIVNTLKEICLEEKIQIEDDALYTIARKADGSLRDSQSLLDQIISFCGQKIKLEELTELLGIIDQAFFFECSDAIANKDVAGGLALAEKVFNHGYDMAEFLNGLAEHFRNMLIIKATNTTTLLEGWESFKDKYQESAKALSETDFLRLIQLATDAAFQIKRSANSRLILEMALLKMINMDKSVELNTLLSHITNLGNQSGQNTGDSEKPAEDVQAAKAGSELVAIRQITQTIKQEVAREKPVEKPNGSPHPEDKAPVPPENIVVSLAKIKNEWPKIIDDVKGKKIHLGSFLNEGYPTSLQDGVLEISFGEGSSFHLKTVEQNRRLVEQVICDNTGFRLRIRCHKNETEEFREVLTQERPAETEEEEQVPESEGLHIPILKRVIEEFDGELVKNAK